MTSWGSCWPYAGVAPHAAAELHTDTLGALVQGPLPMGTHWTFLVSSKEPGCVCVMWLNVLLVAGFVWVSAPEQALWGWE